MNRSRRVVMSLSALGLTSAGCFGRFALTRKIYTWNDGATDNHVAKSIIMLGLVIIPVYPLSMLADWLIFNTVEFFSGSNPIAMDRKDRLAVRHGDERFEFRTTAGGGIEVAREDRVALRYHQVGTEIVIEDLRTGTTHRLPRTQALEAAISGPRSRRAYALRSPTRGREAAVR